MAYLVKLVRDGIEEVVGDHGVVTYGPPLPGEHVALLRRKLIEEAAEYLANPSLDELVDVLAVVESLAIVDLSISPDELRGAETRKFYERGGFRRGNAMWLTRVGEESR